MHKCLLLVCALFLSPGLTADCRGDRLHLRVLGSGGPEMTDGRASTSYLLSLDGKALVLLDAGSGSALNFEKSGEDINDLQFVLFSHLHVDHSADFVAYLKAFYFSGRTADLQVFGPEGNDVMPGTREFIQGLAGERGIYRYLSEYIEEKAAGRFKVRGHDIAVGGKIVHRVYRDERFALSAVPVHHGPIPALAWRIDAAGCTVTFSGDMNNQYDTLAGLARGSDILIAHNAVPVGASGAARQLHMPPEEIGRIAEQAQVKKLVLSHRMLRTLGRERETLEAIARHYRGSVEFADDGDVFFGK